MAAGARAARRRGPVLVEVSGGVTLDTVAAYAAAGADLISVGALTHSAPVLDLGLDLDPDRRERLTVLLAIDVGNTETVDRAVLADDPGDDPPPGAGRRRAVPPEPAGLTHHWRLSTVRRPHRRRARPAARRSCSTSTGFDIDDVGHRASP